jgi:S1-C subfamily serine protease
MWVQAIKEVSKAMFPIFNQTKNGDQVGLGVAGTGYFINNEGVFVTNAHLFDAAKPGVAYIYYGLLPEALHNPFLEIHELARDDVKDLFAGKLALEGNGSLGFSSALPEIGKTICIAGYPLAQISVNAQGGFELGGVRRYFQPSFILDSANVNLANADGLIRNHRGFLIRDFGLYGMSGGPVVDIHGRVLGMQASVTDPRESTNGSRTITVQNAVAIGGDVIQEFLATNGIRFAKADT